MSGRRTVGIGNRLIEIESQEVKQAAANVVELGEKLHRLERQCLRHPTPANVKLVVAAQAAVKKAYGALP